MRALPKLSLLAETAEYLLTTDNGPEFAETKYDLIAVEKQRKGKTPLLINMDSQIPNSAAAEWLPGSGLFSRTALFRRETVFGKSRFDFQIAEGDRIVTVGQAKLVDGSKLNVVKEN